MTIVTNGTIKVGVCSITKYVVADGWCSFLLCFVKGVVIWLGRLFYDVVNQYCLLFCLTALHTTRWRLRWKFYKEPSSFCSRNLCHVASGVIQKRQHQQNCYIVFVVLPFEHVLDNGLCMTCVGSICRQLWHNISSGINHLKYMLLFLSLLSLWLWRPSHLVEGFTFNCIACRFLQLVITRSQVYLVSWICYDMYQL